MARGLSTARRIAACAVAADLMVGLAAGLVGGSAMAHEVQPATADVVVTGDRLEMTVVLALEPMVAGVDLAGLFDTNASPLAGEVDRLRALDPAALQAAFLRDWEGLREEIDLTTGGTRVALQLDGVDVPEVGNVDLTRQSRVRLSADLPDGDAPVTIGWAPRYGALVIRQMEAGLDGYTGFLADGAVSGPIARSERGVLERMIETLR